MELNLTISHLMAFLIMVYIASSFTSGARLVRLSGWMSLWQLLTPARPIWQDIPMMLVVWAATEYLYLWAIRWTNKWVA